MLRDNPLTMRQTVRLSGLVLLFLISLIVYGQRGNSLAPVEAAPSFTPVITNPEILQNWLPQSSYTYTIARIDDYLRVNNLKASSLTIKGNVNNDIANYTFSLLLEPQNQTHHISVAVNNVNEIISTAVAIDGQLQSYHTPTQISDTQFQGLSALISQGLTAAQANNLESALQKFAPQATIFSINQNSITQLPTNPDNPSPTISYSFILTVNGKAYEARLDCPTLTAVDLVIFELHPTKQTFDSGVINNRG